MSTTTLYGVNNSNEIFEIYETKNGMLSCRPIWNYLDEKYFQNVYISFGEYPPSWKLKPWETTKEEYFALLASFDGYFFTKEHLKDMIELLKSTHLRDEDPIQSTRLEIFQAALNNKEYDKFFITATSVADYSEYIEKYYDDEGELIEDKNPTLTNKVWDLWEQFVADLNEDQVLLPECNTYFWGVTEEDYINTITGLYKIDPSLLRRAKDISSLNDAIKFAKGTFNFIRNDGQYCAFEILSSDLIGSIHDLEFHLDKEGDITINVWFEDKKLFKTVSLKELLQNKCLM